MRRRTWLNVMVVLSVSTAGGVVAQQPAENQGVVSTPLLQESIALAEAEAIKAYWTAERMASAEEMLATVVFDDAQIAQPSVRNMEELGDPGVVNGWRPGSGPYVEQIWTLPRGEMTAQMAPQDFGTAPTNPRDGPYGPFQRYSMHGSYVQSPRSFIGKLFFSFGASNFVCSASVIGRSTVATAGHCVSNGSGTFATNVMFCPSFNQGGVNPSRGCWASVEATTSARWHLSGDPDYDYACFVTNTSGTIVNNKIGNVTGWAGRAWNWVDVPETIFGYPQGSPFNGTVIQEVHTVDWYDWDFDTSASSPQTSKIVGNDLTGGSSGGPWYLSWRHPNTEFPDTDNNVGTDPAGAQNGPFINGVNSHKRCRTNCGSPPTTTAGVFWQEMTSPRFRNTVADSGESEDVFAVCLAHVNNNP